ncbi:cyclic nucleotide-binding domain-containing protein [Phaeospirillum tilakii]|uniref:Cyclic nucleotide-binding domain-containing protein n=1 Tax=Phaeospirillum tilakii TaxID=741673 RepID=A0ABW5CCC7_9PROT
MAAGSRRRPALPPPGGAIPGGALRVVSVAPGIWWVEVAEADLRVLCGCPADSVKHLIKRGLILETERGGVRFETGPNAILLSDMPLQNGAFCNLAEFPILQMLYRQGMILPGHPNNRGDRPLLIGLPGQLAAQLDYVARGNYGLLSVEEMLAAGVPPDTAQEWMRIKLRFAFGAIRPTSELIDTCPLGDAPVVLPGGVGLRRVALNRFEFSWRGETALVDLTLGGGRTYQTPYRLGYHDLERGYFSVVHCGEGDGWDAERPTVATILMVQGRVYLIDAGPNIDSSLQALGIGVAEVAGIFHTHCHDDHFCGLTTLFRADHRIKYFAVPAVRASVAKKLAALTGLDEDSFGAFFEVHDLTLGAWNPIEGMEVLPLFSPHPVETAVFHFRTPWEDGYRSYAHLADIVSLDVLAQMVDDDESRHGISSETMSQVRADYLIPADVKKLDIGGGLIHGNAEDFRDDRSGKIVLAHTALPLTREQKSIGSGAPFGTVDVLIPAHQDESPRAARDFLAAAFPGVPEHQLRILLNHPVVTFNPETILLRRGARGEALHLLLTGLVETIEPDSDHSSILSAGAMVGESVALSGAAAPETYRALSFVRALRIPAPLYRSFVARNQMTGRITRLAELRDFFGHTWLFGENLSNLTVTRLAEAAKPCRLAPVEGIATAGRDQLLLVRQGGLVRRLGGVVVERGGVGEPFNESEVLFRQPSPGTLVAAEATELLLLPGDLVRSIPMARWKLLELHQRRQRTLPPSLGVEPSI